MSFVIAQLYIVWFLLSMTEETEGKQTMCRTSFPPGSGFHPQSRGQ
uniref:Uncharacterized protein n=1 Tax=Anguilla anguilla TaxID=7936 RepID=A0A0E9S664_ANGAN